MLEHLTFFLFLFLINSRVLLPHLCLSIIFSPSLSLSSVCCFGVFLLPSSGFFFFFSLRSLTGCGNTADISPARLLNTASAPFACLPHSQPPSPNAHTNTLTGLKEKQKLAPDLLERWLVSNGGENGNANKIDSLFQRFPPLGEVRMSERTEEYPDVLLFPHLANPFLPPPPFPPCFSLSWCAGRLLPYSQLVGWGGRAPGFVIAGFAEHKPVFTTDWEHLLPMKVWSWITGPSAASTASGGRCVFRLKQ